jgi:hypothetical protein
MQAIPQKVRKEIEVNPFYHVCCLPNCSSKKVQMHHSIYYSGRQIKEIVVPACIDDHDKVRTDKCIKYAFKYIAISRNLDYLIINYPKRDWIFELNKYKEYYEELKR